MARKSKSKPESISPGELPESLQELAKAIFAKRDPVAVGCALLGADSESVKARSFESLANWAYGKPVGSGGNGAGGISVRVNCNIPGPARESERTPEEEE